MILWDDVKDLAEKLHDKWWEKYRTVQTEQRIWQLENQGSNLKLDASGNGTLAVWENKTGREARIARVILQADGYTPQTVWTAGYVYTFKGTVFSQTSVLDFLPNAPGEQVFPNIAEYSEWDQPILGKNEVLSLYIVGGPPNVNVSAFIYGRLMPDVAALKGWS